MKTNSLFLDRDGVINTRIVDGYVTKEDDFVLIEGVLESMSVFSQIFNRIFVVTNQQGIGKGLMTEDDLAAIHNSFLEKVAQSGGRIDAIYHCPKLKDEHSFMRKPSIGMALLARRDFPDVKLKHSIMVGDTQSDMLFGRRAGMTTVLVGSEPGAAKNNPHLVDYCFDDLISFARFLKNKTI